MYEMSLLIRHTFSNLFNVLWSKIFLHVFDAMLLCINSKGMIDGVVRNS